MKAYWTIINFWLWTKIKFRGYGKLKQPISVFKILWNPVKTKMWGSVQRDSLSSSAGFNFVNKTLFLERTPAKGLDWNGKEKVVDFSGAECNAGDYEPNPAGEMKRNFIPIPDVKVLEGIIDWYYVKHGVLAALWAIDDTQEFDFEVYGDDKFRISFHWDTNDKRIIFGFNYPIPKKPVLCRVEFYNGKTRAFVNNRLVFVFPKALSGDMELITSIYAIKPDAMDSRLVIKKCCFDL